MKSRERVIRTLEGTSTGRIPRHMWTLPWADIHYPGEIQRIHAAYPDDIIYAPPALKQPSGVIGNIFQEGTFTDEWGCTFTNLEAGIIGEVKKPLITDLDEYEITTPDQLLDIDNELVNRFCAGHDEFVIGDVLPRPFERMQWLRGTENLYMDFALQPEKVLALRDTVHEFYMKQLDVWLDTDIDGIWFMDDWGTQKSLLISLAMWKQFYEPCYRDYIDLAHSKGKKAFMHSDGYIFDIYQSLIDLGLDAVNSQLFCMDIEEIGRRFKGKITFWGELDRQHILPHGSPEEVRQAVQRVYDNLYDAGHVIAQCEFGPGADPDNVREMFKAWNRY
jgi:uroporphyrinogen decarboxylase